MNIDQRLEAITMNLGLLSHEIRDLKSAVQVDAENIRELAGIAQTTHDSIKRLENIALAHEQRLDDHEHRVEGLEKQ